MANDDDIIRGVRNQDELRMQLRDAWYGEGLGVQSMIDLLDVMATSGPELRAKIGGLDDVGIDFLVLCALYGLRGLVLESK